jgi:ribosomal protein L16 Arg81 hydroxylase
VTAPSRSFSGSFTVGRLLHPITSAEFFSEYWETRPLLISREDARHFHGLPGIDDVDELITSTTSNRLRPDDDQFLVRSDSDALVSRRNVPLDAHGLPDVQDVYRAYHDGYSIVVNRIHRRSSAVADLCRALEVAFHHQVGVNLYFTPRSGQGFAPHTDDHDVFILQMHGVKEWHVGTPDNDLPLATQKEPIGPLADFEKFILRAGDTLYLPRGFPHEAVTGSSSSLHLTVGIHVYRWADLLSESLTLLAEENVDFRTALPPGFLDGPLNPARTTDLAARLAKALADDAFLERAKARLGAGLLAAPKAADRGHFRSLDAIAALTENSLVTRSPGMLCRVRSTPHEATIEFAANYVSGPAFLAPAFTYIAEHERFVIGELPGDLSGDDRLDLAGRLISEGLLHYESETP